MNEELKWNHVVAIEMMLKEARDIPTERRLWGELFDLLHEAGHDDVADALKDTIAYRVFELRASLWEVGNAIIDALPRPLRWLIRKIVG
jgi:hypothetical protein